MNSDTLRNVATSEEVKQSAEASFYGLDDLFKKEIVEKIPCKLSCKYKPWIGTEIKEHEVVNAASLCRATAKPDPLQYIKKHSSYHSLETEHFIHCLKGKWLLYFAGDAVYFAFRGTRADDTLDWSSNLNFAHKSKFGGGVHTGFFNHSQQFPISLARKYFDHGFKVVFCGHSRGGSIGHLCALQLLTELPQAGSVPHRVCSIAFGSPYSATRLSLYPRCLCQSRILSICGLRVVCEGVCLVECITNLSVMFPPLPSLAVYVVLFMITTSPDTSWRSPLRGILCPPSWTPPTLPGEWTISFFKTHKCVPTLCLLLFPLPSSYLAGAASAASPLASALQVSLAEGSRGLRPSHSSGCPSLHQTSKLSGLYSYSGIN